MGPWCLPPHTLSSFAFILTGWPCLLVLVWIILKELMQLEDYFNRLDSGDEGSREVRANYCSVEA
jgi:hypothetical protein